MMRDYGFDGWGLGGGIAWIITMLFWFVVVAAIILFIVWVVRSATHHQGGGGYDQRGGYDRDREQQWSREGHPVAGRAWAERDREREWRSGGQPGAAAGGGYERDRDRDQEWQRQTPVPGTGGRVDRDEAISIARRRLATGEITREQYDDIISALTT